MLDDCWQDVNGRDNHGRLQPEPVKFPHGLNFISDHLHSLGLKYGMYSSAGEMTCARFGMFSPWSNCAICADTSSKPDRLITKWKMRRASRRGASICLNTTAAITWGGLAHHRFLSIGSRPCQMLWLLLDDPSSSICAIGARITCIQ